MECSPPGLSVLGILLARILEWVAISFSGDFSDPGLKPMFPLSPALGGVFFNMAPPGKTEIRIDIDIDVLGVHTCHTKIYLFGLKIIFLIVRNKKLRNNF